MLAHYVIQPEIHNHYFMFYLYNYILVFINRFKYINILPPLISWITIKAFRALFKNKTKITFFNLIHKSPCCTSFNFHPLILRSIHILLDSYAVLFLNSTCKNVSGSHSLTVSLARQPFRQRERPARRQTFRRRRRCAIMRSML